MAVIKGPVEVALHCRVTRVTGTQGSEYGLPLWAAVHLALCIPAKCELCHGERRLRQPGTRVRPVTRSQVRMCSAATSQISKTFESTSIRHRFDAKLSDRCLIYDEPKVFAIYLGADKYDNNDVCWSSLNHMNINAPQITGKLIVCSPVSLG